jgi:hypothetical protein
MMPHCNDPECVWCGDYQDTEPESDEIDPPDDYIDLDEGWPDLEELREGE